MTDEPTARLRSTEILARTTFSTLSRSVVDYRRRDGRRQELVREVYDHGNGAAVLLHDPARDRVLLVRQWRFGAYVNPAAGTTEAARGWLIEVPAGLLDGRDPATAIRAEAMEEVGVRIGPLEHVLDCYMSPGSVTERLSLFVAQYTPEDRVGVGGGLVAEGEDIEILEPTVAEAFAMVRAGEIVDAKTILLLYHLATGSVGPTGPTTL
jgi:nudix-type nucleoside diphosphatase (YffH/AdpP family)